MQSAPDIEKTLPKLEEFDRIKGYQLLEIAQNVYSSQDLAKNSWRRKFSHVVITALGETDKTGNEGNRPREQDQELLASFDGILSADLLEFRQKYPECTLLLDGLLPSTGSNQETVWILTAPAQPLKPLWKRHYPVIITTQCCQGSCSSLGFITPDEMRPQRLTDQWTATLNL